MKCSNCNHENKPGSTFCGSCGSKLNTETSNETSNETNTETSTAQNVTNPTNNTVNQTKPKKKNTVWIILGVVAAIIVILIAVGSSGGDNSISPSYSSGQSTNDRTKLGKYLQDSGFTKQSNTKYTAYVEGFTYTFDFNEAIFSMENSEMYNVYYYKDDMFGTAMISDNGLKFVAAYSIGTSEYACETEPSYNQSYICNYMKSSVIELGASMKKTFYSFVNNAGVSSIYNL